MRTATVDWLDSAGLRRLVGIRTDITLGGRKRGEVRETYDVDSGRIVAVSEYTMIQGRSGIVGRIRPDGLAEWYVKDHQGSLALSVVGNGYGSAFAYHPYGAQNLLRTDGQPPSEQYTGKEWDGKYEFYYYGARFFDPVLGMWGTPDPAGQYVNPYAFGFDPINGVDRDGRLFGIDSWAVGFAHKLAKTGSITKAWNEANHRAYMDIKIWGGLVQGTPGDVLARLTYELPQTVVGLGFNLGHNIVGNVRDVEFYREATMVETRSKNWGGVTLGSYITVQSGTDTRDKLFMHEYGHVQQSKILGPLYLFAIGIPSIGNSAGWWGVDDHREFWTERWADNLAKKNFGPEKFTHDKFVGAKGSFIDNPSSKVALNNEKDKSHQISNKNDLKTLYSISGINLFVKDDQEYAEGKNTWHSSVNY